MSIFTRITEEKNAPRDGKPVSANKIAGFYDVVVSTWKPKWEIWALAYGPQILGAAGALSGWYGNMYFRKKLKLRSFGFASTYLPNTVLPFLMAQTFHQMYIQYDIYTNPLECSLCRVTKAAAVQVGFGLIQPLVLVPASSLIFATRHFTQRIPSAIHNRPEFYKFIISLYKPLKVPMAINAIFQVAVAALVTHSEEDQFFHLLREMRKPKIDEDLQES